MHQAPSRSALLLLATVVACAGEMPPPPVLTVTAPQRGLVQTEGRIMVQGIALPGPSGASVSRVIVNDVTATLAADGSFTAVVEVPAGATLLETKAISDEGAAAIDARAVQIGQRRAVGTTIERAVTATLSAEAFARLSAAAGPIVERLNLSALLAPLQPMANLGDSLVNLKLSITKLTIGHVKLTLTPVDGGLQFSAEFGALDLAANAAYGGTLVPDGTTSVSVTADQITIAGTLVVTPAGTAGFTTTLASPTVHTTALRLQASGLAGQVLSLLDSKLASTIQTITTRSAELAIEPLINTALGALAGPQRIDVLGKKLDLQASPSAITFSREGALVTMNVQAKLEGSDSSPGYIFTPNGMPTMNVSNGIQLGLADDLVNELLAEVHALGLLDLHLQKDFGLFDTADITLSLPPMISANNGDGSMRLVLGDMIATLSKQGKTVISAALNAQVDLEILRGTKAQEIALQFGKVHLFVNVIGDPTNPDAPDGADVSDAAAAGIGLQLDSLSQFLITVPVPSVAGVSLDSLALRADNGYVVVSGEVH